MTGLLTVNLLLWMGKDQLCWIIEMSVVRSICVRVTSGLLSVAFNVVQEVMAVIAGSFHSTSAPKIYWQQRKMPLLAPVLSSLESYSADFSFDRKKDPSLRRGIEPCLDTL